MHWNGQTCPLAACFLIWSPRTELEPQSNCLWLAEGPYLQAQSRIIRAWFETMHSIMTSGAHDDRNDGCGWSSKLVTFYAWGLFSCRPYLLVMMKMLLWLCELNSIASHCFSWTSSKQLQHLQKADILHVEVSNYTYPLFFSLNRERYVHVEGFNDLALVLKLFTISCSSPQCISKIRALWILL